MSADDFQAKYASVMESMLKSAVAETTKLFETMVDELKAEISKIKKENEDLKTRCSQFESAKCQPTVYTSEPLPGPSDGFVKCDTAVQCDLVPFGVMLVEQCQPLGETSLQHQELQRSYEKINYSLQEHNYVAHRDASSHMTLITVKDEQEDELIVPCGQVLCDEAGSSQTYTCGTENDGPLINKECSDGEIPVPQKDEDNGLQEIQNQSSEPEHSLVISLAAISDMEEESEVNQNITEIGTQTKPTTSEKCPLMVAQHQSEAESLEKQQPSVISQQLQGEGETSVNDQTDATLQQNADVPSTEEHLAEPILSIKEVACPQPINRRRGRPPKGAKHLKQPVKEILQSSSTELSSLIRVEEVDTTALESPKACPIKPKKTSSLIVPSVQEGVNTALKDLGNRRSDFFHIPAVPLSRNCSSEKEKTSQQLSIEVEEEAIQASSNEVLSTKETLKTPQTESPQTPSVQSRERRTSATLQDAMLLVEAMNQSNVGTTFHSPQTVAAPHQTQCAPHVSTLQTVDEIPDKPQMPPLPVEIHEVSGKLPITELSTSSESMMETVSATRHAPASDTRTRITVVLPNQQHLVTPKTTRSPMLSSTVATQTGLASLQKHTLHSLKTVVAQTNLSNTTPHKIIVMPRSVSSSMPHKAASQPPAQLSSLVSTVVAQNTNFPQASRAASLPLGSSSLSSVPRTTMYVTSRKFLPVVPAKSAATSTQSETPLHSKVIIYPRIVSAVKSTKVQPQVIVATKPGYSKSAFPVMVQSLQVSSSSQGFTAKMDAPTTSDEVATVSSQKRNPTTSDLEPSKQTASVSETIKAPKETCSNLNMSDGLVPAPMLQGVQPAAVQNHCVVVRLTRLPFPVSTKESVSVSKLLSAMPSETQAMLKESTSEEKPSSVVLLTQPPEMSALSTDICPSLKDASQMSVEPNDIQEKPSESSDTCTIFEELSESGYVQPSPSKVSAPAFEELALAFSTTEHSADEPACNLDIEIISNAELNDPPTEEKQSASLIQLTSITSKDTSDPHLQMTKTQFLAQLAVSPFDQAPKQASTNNFTDARASASTTGKKRSQKNSPVAQLRSQTKTPLQSRTETNSEPCIAAETTAEGSKKPRIENDDPTNKDTTSKPIPVNLKKPCVIGDVAFLNKTTNGPSHISPRKSGPCTNDISPKISVSEPTFVSPRRLKFTSESTSVSPRRSCSRRDGIGSENKNSGSVSPKGSTSDKDGASLNGESTSVSPRLTSSTRDGASPKQTRSTSVSPDRSSSHKEDVSPKKNTSVSARMSSLSKKEGVTKMSSKELISGSLRSSTFTKISPSPKKVKRESNSVSPRRHSVTTNGSFTKKTKSGTGFPSARWPKDVVGAKRIRSGESTPAKKPRLLQDSTGPKRSLKVVNAKLSTAAKAKAVAKMKNPSQLKLQGGAKTQLPGNQADCKVVKKCTTTGVWIPPKMPVSKTPSAGGKKSPNLEEKKETRSSTTQNHTVVYPPSVSLHPIPVKAPPIVSPLQPLSVIGWRLLKNQCGECGRILSSTAALESHVSLHTGRRPFSCLFCGKSFPDSKGLKRHGRVHRNGRIHVCPRCGKGFVYRFGLTKHIQMVHSRIKPFVCQICNKGFFTKRDVETHIRIHTGEKPFHCNLCEKKFTRRVELNVHLRWHNGEKRHWCPYCGKGFLDYNNLKRHKYIHTGEKPHSCPHCSKHFTQSGHLKKHVKNVHKIQ
uniref:mucin-5AC-like isoform X2 n=1 Tax=Monopterus albus TaxID=43700 RepID=UPI0009B38BBC|nr:mucin-5AC-like isoform X2 [Monopterus albus]